MASYFNMKGTTQSTFKLGINGPILEQNATDKQLLVLPKTISSKLYLGSTFNNAKYIDDTNYTGNSATTTKLLNARTITVNGNASGSVSFDGSSDVTLNLTVPMPTVDTAYIEDDHNHVPSSKLILAYIMMLMTNKGTCLIDISETKPEAGDDSLDYYTLQGVYLGTGGDTSVQLMLSDATIKNSEFNSTANYITVNTSNNGVLIGYLDESTRVLLYPDEIIGYTGNQYCVFDSAHPDVLYKSRVIRNGKFYVNEDLNSKANLSGGNTFSGSQVIDLGSDYGAKLEVKGTGGDQAFLLTRTGGAQCVLEAGNSIGLFGTKSDHSLQIRTNYTNRMTIGTDGSVVLATDVASSSNSNQVATTKWAMSKFLTSHQSLASYATQTWVEGKNYLTSHQSLAGYATESWVTGKNYATQTWVNQQGFLTSHQSLDDYATKSWVEGKNYLTSHQSLSGYATESWVTGKGYATQTWVEGKNYLTSHQDISGKENSSNKSNDFEGDKESTIKYYNAKVVYDEIQDVREVAEGKTKSYSTELYLDADTNKKYLCFSNSVISTSAEVSNVTSDLTLVEITSGKNDIILNSDYTYLYTVSSGRYNVQYIGTPIELASLKKGDILLIVDVDVPDFWFHSRALDTYATHYVIKFYKLETTKVDLTSYATQTWVNQQGFLTSHQSLTDYATQAWVNQQGFLTSHQSLDDYATKSWVEGKNYLTSHQSLAGYATQTWVNQQGFLKSHQSLAGYATESWVTGKGYATQTWVGQQGFLTSHQSLSGYATETWVNQQGFLKTHQSLDDYATKSWVEGKNYLTEHQSLTDYATKTWVEGKNYLTEHQSLTDYATKSDLSNKISYGDVLMPTNSFGGKLLYINSIDNPFASADKKFWVTITKHTRRDGGTTYPYVNTSKQVTDDDYFVDGPVIDTMTSQAHNLFDGSYESSVNVGANAYLKVRIMFGSDTSPSGTTSYFSGYPYGTYYLSYYYVAKPTEASQYRVYNKYSGHTVGWKKYDAQLLTGNRTLNTANCIEYFDDGGNYQRSCIEFIIFGDGDNSYHSTQLTQIEQKLERPDLSSNGSTVTKYGDQTLYNKFYWNNNHENTIEINPNGNISISGDYYSNSKKVATQEWVNDQDLGVDIVTLTASSGTLSDADFAKLQKKTTMIYYNDGTYKEAYYFSYIASGEGDFLCYIESQRASTFTRTMYTSNNPNPIDYLVVDAGHEIYIDTLTKEYQRAYISTATVAQDTYDADSHNGMSGIAVASVLNDYQTKITSSNKISYSNISDTPSNVSSFTNDSGYLTLDTLPIWDGSVE